MTTHNAHGHSYPRLLEMESGVGDRMTTDRARIVGLQHVAVPFPGTPESVEVARRFFGAILGLAEVSVPPALRGIVLWFKAGDQELHIFSEPSGVAANDQSRRHPCLQVDTSQPSDRNST